LTNVDEITDLQRQQKQALTEALDSVSDPEKRAQQANLAIERVHELVSALADVRREALLKLLAARPELSKAALARRMNLSRGRLHNIIGSTEYPGRYKRERPS
jgi:predicted transcriptional regulator